MARQFKDFTSLFNYLQRDISKSLKNEVAKAAVSEMQNQIEEVVYSYDAVFPEKRRMYDDGLIDPRNIEVQSVTDGMISIENIAYDGDRNVPLIVETGEGYEFTDSPELTRGRKFTEATRESLRNTGIIHVALKNGLRKQGHDVK